MVGFSRYGEDGGRPVVAHYGTPGTRHLGPRMIAAVERAGVDLLVADRPGYGNSTRWPGRTIADVVGDVEALADLHGWDRFAVWGGSGGGPHALACAALMAKRVFRCAAVVSPAPYGVEGLDWLDGMSPGNVEEFNLALQGEDAYRPIVEKVGREAVEATEAGQVSILPEYDLPEADLEVLRARMSEPGHLERVVASFGEGTDGWIDDGIAMVTPWGFDVADINLPLSVWYGPEDVLVPRGHAEWLLSHIPGSERHELPHGHLLEDDDLDNLYAWLVADG